MGEKIGVVTHYYTNIEVGIIKLEKDLELGQRVRFKGATTDFEQEIEDMQYDHEDVEMGEAGQEVGVKVDEKVREGDEVYAV